MTTPPPGHRSRYGWLGRPVTWRLGGATLSMTDESGGGRSFALRDVHELRLFLMPSRFSEHLICELRLADGETLQICDAYQRFFLWKVSSQETYRGFVLALCAALVAEGRDCRFRAGPPAGQYLLITLAMLIAIYLLAQFAVILLEASEADRNGLLAFEYGLILLKSPYWRRSNRQAAFDPTAIPEELLPPEVRPAGTRS